MRIAAGCLLALLALPATASAAVVEPYAVVVLQGLDKITARISTFTARVGEMVRFGTLEITARACYKSPPVEPPESAAFLEIEAVDPGRPAERVFSGWMFASSPSISALEHPVYDVWVLDCEEPLPPEARAPGGSATPPGEAPADGGEAVPLPPDVFLLPNSRNANE